MSSTLTSLAPVSDGLYLSGPAAYFIVEDVWYLKNEVPCTVTVTIEDTVGNTGTGQAAISVAPGAPARLTVR